MKSNAKLNLLIIGILLALLSIPTTNLSYITNNSKKSLDYSDESNLDKENLKISKISDQIHINGNSGWANAKTMGICTGSGTYSNPYVIENLEIDGKGSSYSILIENSNVYFRIENCTVYNSWEVIKLSNSTNGILIDNDFYKRNIGLFGGSGLFLNYSNNIIVSGNNIAQKGTGILLYYSDNNTISKNLLATNGVLLFESKNNTISENEIFFSYNGGGIYLGSSTSNTIIRNVVYENDYGIWMELDSDNNTISENSINDNSLTGIFLNISIGNHIFLNCFSNTLNANDDGSANHWDNGTMGNYWADYAGSDANGDGIGDIPYNITGSAGSQDNFPLMNCPSPTEGGGIIPGYNLFFLLGILSLVAIVIGKKVKKS